MQQQAVSPFGQISASFGHPPITQTSPFGTFGPTQQQQQQPFISFSQGQQSQSNPTPFSSTFGKPNITSQQLEPFVVRKGQFQEIQSSELFGGLNRSTTVQPSLSSQDFSSRFNQPTAENLLVHQPQQIRPEFSQGVSSPETPRTSITTTVAGVPSLSSPELNGPYSELYPQAQELKNRYLQELRDYDIWEIAAFLCPTFKVGGAL